jgi:predicted O-linked N-acetylglucosamine transferase (SPINDLY family)
MGLPIVTCCGNSFAGRVCASLLRAIGLPELVAENVEDYERLALEIALGRISLRDLNWRLAENRLTHPLFDTPRFCRHIESAYSMMRDIAERGEAPRSFAVAMDQPRVQDL